MAKYCYRLQACGDGEDINNLCLETYVPDGNKTVYINGDPSRLYVLRFNGVDTCICDRELPPYTLAKKQCIVRDEPRCFGAKPCDGSKKALNFCTTEPVGIGLIVEIKGECWEITNESSYEGQPLTTIDAIYSDCETCRGFKPEIWTVQNCQNPRDIRQLNLSQSVSQGDVITVRELRGCFEVLEPAEIASQNVTILQIYRDCKTCTGQNGNGKVWRLKDCKTQEEEVAEIQGGVLVAGDVITVKENGNCYELLTRTDDGAQNTYTYENVYKGCKECEGANETFYRVESCKGLQVNTVKLLGGAVQVGDIVTVAENNDGWQVLASVQGGVDTWTITGYLDSCEDCDTGGGDCAEDGERTIAYATMVRLPEPPIPDKGFKECCYTNLVLADENDNDPYRNDFTGFYFQKQTGSDDCEFILHELATGDEYALNNDVYGTFKNFGSITSNPTLTTYVVDWRKVLNVLGAGLYRVERQITVAGLQFSMMSNTFTLDHFSNVRADKTIRIDSLMSGTLVHKNVNFSGSGFKTSLRTNGFFGRREPKYKQDNLVKRNYDTVQISMSQENEYQLQTGLIPECITEEVYDFLLFGNELFLSDYNLINHSYKFRLHEAEFDTNKGGKYYTTNRDARLNLTFTDRVKNKRKINC